jgi:hypothetical protein
VIINKHGLKGAIHSYMVALGLYESAKILKFNNDAGDHPGAYIQFKFKDGKTMETWHYIKDLIEKK